jgi:CubicO group peptidase (beta-lactamase class C family)
MFPTESMRKNLAHMHQRDTSGKLNERSHLYRRAFFAKTKEEQDNFFQSAGAGLFSKPKEYVKIMGALLNGGKSAATGNRILKEETVNLMWENQIPNQPDFARGGVRVSSPSL